MKRLLLALFWVAISGTSALAGGHAGSTETENCYAVVQDEKAAFIFPVIEDEKWTWFRKETTENKLEYSWEVLLSGSKQSFKFGVFLFKDAAEKEKSGTLTQLISEAQWTVFDYVIAPNGESNSKMLEDMKIVAKVIDGGVVVAIADKKTLSKTFSNHPEKAQFVVRTPYDEPYMCTASIQYYKK